MYARHLFPGYAALQCVNEYAKILQILAQVGIPETVLFPALGHAKQAELKRAVLPANPADFAVQIGAEIFLAVG